VWKGLARQFHQRIFSTNQKSSNLNAWEKIPQAKTLQIAYEARHSYPTPIKKYSSTRIVSA
jgi:hypothetical protein